MTAMWTVLGLALALNLFNLRLLWRLWRGRDWRSPMLPFLPLTLCSIAAAWAFSLPGASRAWHWIAAAAGVSLLIDVPLTLWVGSRLRSSPRRPRQ